MTPQLIVIVGPTASGKSDLAVELALAQENGAEIISADSRQVYKGLDIGSGKITAAEMKGVPHHLLDVADPRDQFTVVQYVELAKKAVEDIRARGKTPIIVGGTGFYIHALIDGVMLPEVPPNKELRAELSLKSTDELFEQLKKLDPERAAEIDSRNPRRLIRAIEIASELGAVPKTASKPLPYTVKFIGLDVKPEILRARIRARLMKRLSTETGGGMIAEAEMLHKNGLSFERMEELGLEYRYLSLLLQKKMTLDEMTEKLETEIWRYAKRQLTWFKRDPRIEWQPIREQKS
jgi:tRNA dimethylallyltransferase